MEITIVDGKYETQVLNGSISVLNEFDGDAEIKQDLEGVIDISNSLDGEFGVFQKISDASAYTGRTNVIPSNEKQVLNTIGKVLGDNITIQPIPSNYGKITWNGVYLLVE